VLLSKQTNGEKITIHVFRDVAGNAMAVAWTHLRARPVAVGSRDPAAAMEKRGIAPKSPECREAGETLEKKREDWEWEPSGRETQCLNSPPWLVDRARERVFCMWGPGASGCKWGRAGSVHVCTPRVHTVAPRVLIPAGC
jgi:hypothetical protein